MRAGILGELLGRASCVAGGFGDHFRLDFVESGEGKGRAEFVVLDQHDPAGDEVSGLGHGFFTVAMSPERTVSTACARYRWSGLWLGFMDCMSSIRGAVSMTSALPRPCSLRKAMISVRDFRMAVSTSGSVLAAALKLMGHMARLAGTSRSANPLTVTYRSMALKLTRALPSTKQPATMPAAMNKPRKKLCAPFLLSMGIPASVVCEFCETSLRHGLSHGQWSGYSI